MGVIHFLKPTKWKIIIAVALFIVFSEIPTIPCVTGTVGSFMVRESAEFSFCSLPSYFSLWKSTGHYYDYFGLHNGKLFAFIYVLIISYILSSLVMYFFIRKK